MTPYLDALTQVMDFGSDSTDRTGIGTRRLIGMQQRYNLAQGFPLVTTKRVFWKAVVGELLWFLEGSTNRHRLEVLTHGTQGEHNTIWDDWAATDGGLGPIYGAQWRCWGSDPSAGYSGIDQIANLIQGIKDSPESRRHIVSAWNPEDLYSMALPPCHTLWQVFITGDRMDLMLYQRSADMFLGVPFNIASYSLLLMMLAQVSGYQPGSFIHTIGDAHIYHNHFAQAHEQLERLPKARPTVRLNPEITSIFDFKPADITLEGYDPHPSIAAPVAV